MYGNISKSAYSAQPWQFTDAFTLKEMLGHSQIQTTEGYISPPLSDMQRAVNAMAEGGGHVLSIIRAQNA